MPFNLAHFERIEGVLFDLDGTLLNTAPDLATTLNTLLLTEQREALPYSAIRPVVSEGVAGLLKLGFNITKKNPNFTYLANKFITYYRQYIYQKTCFFIGVEKLLIYLETKGFLWGIVTNKSTSLTTLLVNHFSLLKKAKCIITGDTLIYSKPHPAPLLHACKCIQSYPRNCVYIGDAKQDIDAANAANMRSLIALYGYSSDKKELTSWKASGMIKKPLDLVDWLELINET